MLYPPDETYNRSFSHTHPIDPPVAHLCEGRHAGGEDLGSTYIGRQPRPELLLAHVGPCHITATSVFRGTL
jgi:hypothetical protein